MSSPLTNTNKGALIGLLSGAGIAYGAIGLDKANALTALAPVIAPLIGLGIGAHKDISNAYRMDKGKSIKGKQNPLKVQYDEINNRDKSTWTAEDKATHAYIQEAHPEVLKDDKSHKTPQRNKGAFKLNEVFNPVTAAAGGGSTLLAAYLYRQLQKKKYRNDPEALEKIDKTKLTDYIMAGLTGTYIGGSAGRKRESITDVI